MATVVKNLPVSAGVIRDEGSIPLVGKIPRPTPILLPRESHGQRSLVAKKSDRTEQLSICLFVLDYLMSSMYIITKITKGDRRLSVRLMQHQKDLLNHHWL